MEKSTSLHDDAMQHSLDDVVQRYHLLDTTTKDQMEQLLGQVTEHEQYKDRYQTCMDWILAKRHELQQVTDASGPRSELVKKLEIVQVTNIE